MGDRSNLIIITNRQELSLDTGDPHDLISGLAVYSHWGGRAAQIDALNAVLTHGLRRLNDPGYFTRIAVRAFTAGDDGETGSGITPIAMPVRRNVIQAEIGTRLNPYILDNDGYLIPIINLTTEDISIYRHTFFDPHTPMTPLSVYPLNDTGLRLTLADIENED